MHEDNDQKKFSAQKFTYRNIPFTTVLLKSFGKLMQGHFMHVDTSGNKTQTAD